MLPFLFLPSLDGASFHSRSAVEHRLSSGGVATAEAGTEPASKLLPCSSLGWPCPQYVRTRRACSSKAWKAQTSCYFFQIYFVSLFSKWVIKKNKFHEVLQTKYWTGSCKYFVKEKIKPERTEAWFHLLKYLKNNLLLPLLHFLQWMQLNKQLLNLSFFLSSLKC